MFRKQTGSMLILAITLLVIGGGILFTMTRLTHQRSDAVIFEVQGLRTYDVATSALDIALVQLFPLDQTNASCSSITPTQRTWPTECVSQVVCQQAPVDTTTLYRLTATATCGEGQYQTSRVIMVEAGG